MDNQVERISFENSTIHQENIRLNDGLAKQRVKFEDAMKRLECRVRDDEVNRAKLEFQKYESDLTEREQHLEQAELDVLELKKQMDEKDRLIIALRDDSSLHLRKQADELHDLDFHLHEAEGTINSQKLKVQKVLATNQALRDEIDALKRSLNRQRNLHTDEFTRMKGDFDIDRKEIIGRNGDLSKNCQELENLIRDRDVEIHDLRLELDRLRHQLHNNVNQAVAQTIQHAQRAGVI
jgi:hypothetical protein